MAAIVMLACAPAAAEYRQQGPKLVGSGAVSYSVVPYAGATPIEYGARQGAATALSADGNTALVAGPDDSCGQVVSCSGSVWAFTRTNGVWAQQGEKFVDPQSEGVRAEAIALSADGNTALVSVRSITGANGANLPGQARIFIRANGAWARGPELRVADFTYGELNLIGQSSVALSADGNTAMVGNSIDATPTASGGFQYQSAAAVFVRDINGRWSQQAPNS
jgi:hypothetical protein